MMVFFYILGSVIVVSLISLVGILTLGVKRDVFQRSLFLMIGFSAGAMLGAVFFDLLPEALEYGMEYGLAYVLIGVLFFFVVERLIFWHHCHMGKCDIHTFTYMNLVGDAIHNFLDGVVIAAAFLHSVPIGIAASVAIAFHEIPQEIGDFGVLMYGGFSASKALTYNFFTALMAIVGALVSYFYLAAIENFVPFLLFFAAGGFLYVAGTDLFPEIKKEADMRNGLKQLVAIVLGVLMILVVTGLVPHT